MVGKQYAPALSSLQSAPALLEWLCQEQYGSGLTASCLQKWGMAPYVARECGAEEQNIDHVAFHYPIHWPTHGASGLTVLVTRQPNGCSTLATRSSVAYQWIRTHSNNEEVIELTVNVNLYWGRVRSCQGRGKSLFISLHLGIAFWAMHGSELSDAIKQRITLGNSWVVLSVDWPLD